MSEGSRWDEIVDVVVVGTGAGGMTSALLAADGGAEVLVVEKGQYIGGTTGVSGGDMWIPNNHHIADQDTREDAINYISRLSDGRASDPKLIERYVDTAPSALKYLEENTEYKSLPHIGLDDYYSVILGRIPGTKTFPRTVSAAAYPAVERLGVEGAKLINRGPWVQPVEIAYGEIMVTPAAHGMPVFYGEDTRPVVTQEEMDKRVREGYRAKGGGLIAPLYRALLDRGVEVRPSFPASRLLTNDDGAVIGVVAGPAGRERRIGARRGVVLAAGGFEWNPEMVKTYLGYEVKPCTPWTNTGDGHQMAMAVGAKLGNMTTFFSFGVMYDPWELGRDSQPLPQMAMGLGAGSIIVNRHAKRFMHGGYTYNDFSHPFGFFDQRNPGYTNKGPGWCVFGAGHFESGAVFGAKTVTDADGDVKVVGPKGQPAPSWIVAANSIRELAKKMDVDPEALEETVTRYNKFAEEGEDPDWADPEQIRVLTGPDNVNIKPINGPIYGAIQQWPGTIGTNGGLRIDEHARVLGHHTPIIDGLYAAGNTSASVLGAVYPGGGSCVGPSMVTGFWAGSHLGAKAPRDIG
jgi:succinate dehydrogenase/fumarate reductase flavoprotein subunit